MKVKAFLAVLDLTLRSIKFCPLSLVLWMSITHAINFNKLTFVISDENFRRCSCIPVSKAF